MDYLSPSEQSKIRNNGKLGNSTVVKKQLSKYFYYVSIRNRGKEVRIGKPKFNFKDDVDEAIQSVIYGSIDLNVRSLSSWYRKIGINLISMEEIEKYAKELYGKEKLVFWRVEYMDIYKKQKGQCLSDHGGELSIKLVVTMR